MSDPRDISKAWAIVEIVGGAKQILLSGLFGYLMFTQPDLPSMFDGDRFITRQVSASSYWSIVCLFLIGVAVVVHGILRLRRRSRVPRAMVAGAKRPEPGVPERAAVPKALLHLPGVGYRAFVAWRYLLVYHHRISVLTKLAIVGLVAARIALWGVLDVGLPITDKHDPLQILGLSLIVAIGVVVYWGILRFSWLASFVFAFGIVFALLNVSIGELAGHGKLPWLDPMQARQLQQGAGLAMLAGLILSFLAAFFGTLRGFFTFFTTVPIGGVWIGTSALVLVLAVMSGFETDLRDKILGSNAHIQVTKEDGEFFEWREVKTKIDNIPGVVASTPYAVSEVVIAANNNGMNVIIKGIDPNTVGRVTDLVNDLEDKEAMRRLEPLVDLGHDRNVPVLPKPADAPDPPPTDMVTGGDPIDFSNSSAGAGSGSAGSGSGSGAIAPAPSAGSARPHTGSPAAGSGSSGSYGGDATRIIGSDLEIEVLDMLDSDLIRWMVGDSLDPGIHVVDVPADPSLARRTQALPGILVGRELVKQTHLYTGEEVRVVSPLSDPSNPDATGTPIPFNRDYRVAGVFYTGMYEYDLKFVYVSLDSLQDFLDLGDTVDGIEIRVESGDDTDRYVREGKDDDLGLIRKALGPGYRVQDWREINRSLFSALKLEKIAMFLVLGIVILVASFSIIGNLIMVVVEKGREIALLKTLGASDTGVMQMFAVQGLIIGLIGTFLGISFGLLGCLAMEKFGLPLDPDVYYINRLPIHVDPQSVIAAAITGVLISIVATLYPALLAARVRPSIGMRH